MIAAIPQGTIRHWHLLRTLIGAWWHGMSDDEHRAAFTLMTRLGTLKGPLMKAAQLTAMLPDVLPPVYQKVLQELCIDAPSMGWPMVRRQMAYQLGERWMDHFAHFTPQASHCASLGQVHHALWHQDQHPIACKVQYPNMDQALRTDLHHIRLLLSVYNRFYPHLQPDAFFQEMRTRLLQELDYTQEARHMQWFSHLLQDQADIHIPRVFEVACTKNVLTMSWHQGIPLVNLLPDKILPERQDSAPWQGTQTGSIWPRPHSVPVNVPINPVRQEVLGHDGRNIHASHTISGMPTFQNSTNESAATNHEREAGVQQNAHYTQGTTGVGGSDPENRTQTSFTPHQRLSIQDRQALSRRLVHAWYVPFFRAGVLHGDPHAGNVLVSPTHITMLDFGCVRVFTPLFVENFWHLVQAVRHNNIAQQYALYEALGIIAPTPTARQAVQNWIAFILAPFTQATSDTSTSLRHLCDPAHGQKVLMQVHQAAVHTPGMVIPPEFFIFGRVGVVLGAILMRLDVALPWADLLDRIAEGTNAARCQNWQERLGITPH